MKRLFKILFIATSFVVRAQNHELQYRGDFGFPLQSLKPIGLYYPNTIDDQPVSNEELYRKARFYYCQNNAFSYKYQIYNKFKLFLVGGLDYSMYKAALPLYGYHGFTTNIDINYKRLGLSLGVAKQFHFYDSKVILELGYNIVRRIPIERDYFESVDLTTSERDFIKYEYTLEVKYDGTPNYYNSLGLFDEKFFDTGFLHSELNINTKFSLWKNLYLNFGLTYEPRVYFFYRHSYSIYNYYNGSTTPSNISSGSEFNYPVPNPVMSSFLKINLGFSYKF
ncbi:MAG: hypothetical protein FGM14_09395 [Flavobacteriales bacterium]|nr:hypothetical protein [Flavobacteriales bacterium]